MKVDIKNQFQGRSYRVKGVDVHSSEPWLLTSLFTGTVQVWNYDTGVLLRSLEVSKEPVRACRFIPRKNWIVLGGDDMQIRVFNTNTFEKVAQFEAHSDYIRALAVHPTQPFLLSTGDDMVVKMWNWDESWSLMETYRGHSSYILGLAINPKDPNSFATACMDKTVKVWNISSPVANYTLQAHETKGVNYVEFYPFPDRPYILTTSDDKTIKIFDYQSKSCVATLVGHTHNVSFAVWHPELPIIISGSEDSTVKVWNARSYKLEQSLNYGMERAWCVCAKPQSNLVAIGYETGSLVLRMGSDKPTVSMDQTGKLVWSKHLEAFSATIRSRVATENEDEMVPLNAKDLGSVEVQPSFLQHSPNGRFVAVVGDGEYIVYTALAWRNKMFGSALDFAWAADSNEYAVRLPDQSVRAYHNFTERDPDHFDIEYPTSKLWGGQLLGVSGGEFVAFYDWETGKFISRVDVEATQVIWADSGELLVVVTEDSAFVLRYDRDAVQQKLEETEEDVEIEDAFEVVQELSEKIRTAKWVGDCLIFTTTANRLNYLVGNESYNISHYDKDMYLLGYLPRDNAIYLADKDVNVVAHALSLAVVEYQTVVLRGDMELASELLSRIAESDKTRVARFLEAQGYADLAYEVSRDIDHKFELALALGNLSDAQKLVESSGSVVKYRALGDRFLQAWKIDAAASCFEKAEDLDSLLLLWTSTGDSQKLSWLASKATDQGRFNLAFEALWAVGDLDAAASLLHRAGRSAEAALLSLTYGGDVQSNVEKWKKQLVSSNREAIADLILEPSENPESFPTNVGQKTEVRRQIDDLIDVSDSEIDAAEVAGEEAHVETTSAPSLDQDKQVTVDEDSEA